MSTVCAICKVLAVQYCAGCRNVYYCGREHQKAHWKEGHKHNCRPFKIVQSEKYGREMIATRDIKPGETIFVERPTLVGPKVLSKPLCLGCHKYITANSEDLYTCKKCGFPMCNESCTNSNHHKDECELMEKHNFKCNFAFVKDEKSTNYAVILPLRCLLCKFTNEQKFKHIKNLESNLKEKLKHPLYSLFKTKLTPFIKRDLHLDFTDNDVLEIAAILDTNAFEVRNAEGSIRIRGLYPTAAMVNHDCKPNTKHSFHGEEFDIMFIATVPIPKGEPITTTYTQTLLGTLERRNHLREVKNFNCTCKRCNDSTELGTFLGSIYCSICKYKNRCEQSPKMLSTNPLMDQAIWKCEQCDHEIPEKQIVWGNKAIHSEIQRLDKTSPLHLEMFIEKYREVLHPWNYHTIAIKYALSQIYGNKAGYTLSDLTDDLIERKIELCNELIEIADILEPGWSRFRGSLIYELQAALVVQTKRDLSNAKITLESAQERMNECLVLLKEATEILKSEPDMKEFFKEKLELLVAEMELSQVNT